MHVIHINPSVVYRSASILSTTVNNIQNISLSISSVIHRDIATGLSTKVDLSTWNTTSCGTKLFTSISQETFQFSCGYSISNELLNMLSTSGMICRSVVQEVSYLLIHDSTAAGDILSVSADIVIADIPLPTNDIGKYILQTRSSLFFNLCDIFRKSISAAVRSNIPIQ